MQRWTWVHKWSSLICTLFLLAMCVTGLPLIFHEEIDKTWGEHQAASVDTPRADLDVLVTSIHEKFPQSRVVALFFDDRRSQGSAQLLLPQGKEQQVGASRRHVARFDAVTGQILDRGNGKTADRPPLMDLILRCHRDLFWGWTGQIVLATVAVLFLASIVSGMVLYGPFTKKLKFGEIRTDRSRRVRWLDLHNLVGIVTLTWMIVLATTGFMGEMVVRPAFEYWQRTYIPQAMASLHLEQERKTSELSSIQDAYELARKALPDMKITSLAMPGGRSGSSSHYMAMAKGNTPRTEHVLNAAVIDARSGTLATVIDMPWYMQLPRLASPIHFANYGGLPLKIIWALFDVATIFVLISGLYLWLARGRRQKPAQPMPGAASDAAK